MFTSDGINIVILQHSLNSHTLLLTVKDCRNIRPVYITVVFPNYGLKTMGMYSSEFKQGENDGLACIYKEYIGINVIN